MTISRTLSRAMPRTSGGSLALSSSGSVKRNGGGLWTKGLFIIDDFIEHLAPVLLDEDVFMEEFVHDWEFDFIKVGNRGIGILVFGCGLNSLEILESGKL